MSMLGYHEIKRERTKGNIFIETYNENQVNPNSYDIRLGENFVREHISNFVIGLDLSDSQDFIWSTVQRNSRLFIIEPGENILAHTEEFIGSTKYATLLKARSTLARCNLEICASAGFGDVGYINRWTLEIYNRGKNSIKLMPGMRVAQIAFSEVKRPNQYEGAYKNDIMNWEPEMMLPVLGHSRVF